MLTIIMATLVITAYVAAAENNNTTSTKPQELYKSGSLPSFKGSEKWFTGDVQVDLIFPPNETAHYSGAYVTFQPGARTFWHQHSAGQHMIVIEGVALTGTRDGKIIKINPGDVVWCPKDTDHWHGATPDTSMKHLVITGANEGGGVIWKEKVTDEEYMGK